MLTDKEIKKLHEYVKELLQHDYDLFDTKSFIDVTLTYQENKSILDMELNLFYNKSIKDKMQDYEETLTKIALNDNNVLNRKEYAFKRIFDDTHIVGLVGIKNCGKTNNLIAMIKEFRETKNQTPIYIYGFKPIITDYLKRYGCTEISEIKHLIGKQNCILICDEYQRLKLNDRRYTDERDEFKNYVYHNNVYVILSSPDVREFNSIIGGVIEKWLVKTLSLSDCVNGSQLKKAVDDYKGNYKHLGSIELPKDQILILNSLFEQRITCEYIEEADSKKGQKNIFI